VIAVSGQQQILSEENPHAMALANGDGWWNIQKAIKNLQRRLR
jgi:hypothetical protein